MFEQSRHPELAEPYRDEALQITAVYRVAQQLLPHRPKHDSNRGGIPWLLYQARSAHATVLADRLGKEGRK